MDKELKKERNQLRTDLVDTLCKIPPEMWGKEEKHDRILFTYTNDKKDNIRNTVYIEWGFLGITVFNLRFSEKYSVFTRNYKKLFRLLCDIEDEREGMDRRYEIDTDEIRKCIEHVRRDNGTSS
jgi:hypothetical protein